MDARASELFLLKARQHLLSPLDRDGSLRLAAALKAQFRDRLAAGDDDDARMLPSHNHILPTGRERGRVLSVDVGGTTLRTALVELLGDGGSAALGEHVRVSGRLSWKIDDGVRALEGMAFFLWMADRIAEAAAAGEAHGPCRGGGGNGARAGGGGGITLALAWSFPIRQTSLRTGLIRPMGKGFRASDGGMVGRDLATVIETACATRGRAVTLRAVVNDSSAALLAEAYAHPSTGRMGLILGTGVNASCYLPVAAVGPARLRDRDPAWLAAATHVVVNTELGLFGAGDGVLPLTRWDEQLRRAHPRPDFQPFEYCVSGHYLGEICRLALVEAIGGEARVLAGVVPPSLRVAYSLDSETITLIARDDTATLREARAVWTAAHPCATSPSDADLGFIRALAGLVARRSARLAATAVFALWDLRRELATTAAAAANAAADAPAAAAEDRTVVAYNGGVIENWPGYRGACQDHIDDLVGAGGAGGEVELVAAWESSLKGAAVAAVCGGGDGGGWGRTGQGRTDCC